MPKSSCLKLVGMQQITVGIPTRTRKSKQSRAKYTGVTVAQVIRVSAIVRRCASASRMQWAARRSRAHTNTYRSVEGRCQHVAVFGKRRRPRERHVSLAGIQSPAENPKLWTRMGNIRLRTDQKKHRTGYFVKFSSRSVAHASKSAKVYLHEHI